MLNQKIKPSTLGGIKRHAKQLKKTNEISHSKALDIAAKRASFMNYAHALNQLKSVNTLKSGYQLFFTVYWYDPRGHKTGREVLEIELSASLLKIASKGEFRRSNYLSSFRLASKDHFVNDHVSYSQNEAIKTICKAVRELRFMEATGLKPSDDYNAAYPNRDHNNKLPNADHSTNWYDPSTGQFILVDEPYLDPIVDSNRATWAKKHNWYIQASKWSGMYYPGHSSMFISTDALTGYDFKSLMTKIDNISSSLTEVDWTGISSEGHDTFFSPLAVTPQDKKRALAKGTIYRESTSKTQPMRSWNAPLNERRPNAIMPIESHQLAAKLIKAIEQSSATPVSVNKRLSSIKSKLEDWFFSEYENSVTDKFDLFYYGGIDRKDPLVLQIHSSKEITSLLRKLKALLLEAYVDCEPLRKIIEKLNTSIKFTSKLPINV